MADNAYRYAAFISYRHMSPDQEIAQELQRLLEHNRIRPGRAYPRNIRPVFLDTSELPTVENLEDGIISALENSECLFVICSPNLQRSKYCMREIEYFKEIHGGSLNRVYTVLVDGTPEEAFPETLRREIYTTKDENGRELRCERSIEPLFSDVRAPSIRESIKKLRKKEFLRLAAAYYRCSFDQLYRRRKRWIAKIALEAALGVMAVGAAFGLYALQQELQYCNSKATTYAVFAENCNQSGDELLAITLCDEAWDAAGFSGSNRLITAMRSAAVQRDYKQNMTPLSCSYTIPFDLGSNQFIYISQSGNRVLFANERSYVIADAKTGQQIKNSPMYGLQVLAKDYVFSKYISMETVQDEDGVFWDAAVMRAAEDDSVLNSTPICESERAASYLSPYKIVNVPGNQRVFLLQKNNANIAYLDEACNLISPEEALRLFEEGAEADESPKPRYIVSNGNKLTKGGPCVKDAAGSVVFDLPAPNLTSDFSDDWNTFAYVFENVLYVYETEGWSQLGEYAVDDRELQFLRFLKGTHYALLTYLPDDVGFLNTLISLDNGKKLAGVYGWPYVDRENQRLYCIKEDGLTCYDYRDLPVAQKQKVIRKWEERTLVEDENGLYLIEDNGNIRTEIPKTRFRSCSCADDLSRIMVLNEESAVCVDCDGTVLWEQPCKRAVISPDGRLAAIETEEGAVTVLSADDGKTVYEIPPQALEAVGIIVDMSVSEKGTCVFGMQGAALYTQEDPQGIFLGVYYGGQVFDDGMILLECNSAYVDDFLVVNAKDGKLVYRPEDNTNLWAYSAESGFLVREMEIAGNHAKNKLEVLRRTSNGMKSVGEILLFDQELTDLRLDSTGTVLSLRVGGVSLIYRLDDMKELLRANGCALFYENGFVTADAVYGSTVYQFPVTEANELHEISLSQISGSGGIRRLTDEEKTHYAFTE